MYSKLCFTPVFFVSTFPVCLQYYLDLGSSFLEADEDVDGATGGDGYLCMNSMSLEEPTDYTKMTPAPPPPQPTDCHEAADTEQLIVDLSHRPSLSKCEEKREKEENYVNLNPTKKNHYRGNKSEIEPLLDTVDEVRARDSPGRRKKRFSDSPPRLSTQALIHRNEDSDSGHESFVPAGSSPEKLEENDGYLSPKSLTGMPEMPAVAALELNGIVKGGNSTAGSGTKNTAAASNGQARLYNSNYRDLCPPDYSAVMEAVGETNV